jgi:hypothetical protein
MTLDPEDDPIIGTMPITFAYSDTQWAPVLAALPVPLTDNTDLNAVRRELEDAATLYLAVRASYRRKMGRAPAWKKTEKLIAEAIAHAEKHGHAAVLPALREAQKRVTPSVQGHEMIAFAHQNRRAPERAQLYDSALSIWIKAGGRLSVTKTHAAKPSGAAIRYLIATLEPIMKSEMPGAEGLAKIIKGVKKHGFQLPSRRTVRPRRLL